MNEYTKSTHHTNFSEKLIKTLNIKTAKQLVNLEMGTIIWLGVCLCLNITKTTI